MKIVNKSSTCNNVFDFINDKNNILYYRVVKALELAKTSGNKKIPWYNHPGGLTFAFSIKSSRPAPICSMIVAYTIAKLLNGEIKWPNDVLLNGKKVAGILTKNDQRRYIVGVGLNLNNQYLEDNIKDKATSYFLHYKKEIDPHFFIKSFVEKFAYNIKKLSIKKLEKMLIYKNKKIKLKNKIYEFVKLNKDGSIMWKIDGKLKSFTSSSLSFTNEYSIFTKDKNF